MPRPPSHRRRTPPLPLALLVLAAAGAWLPARAQTQETTPAAGTPPARAAAAADAAEAAIDTFALRAHTRFLADDMLRGRDAGTRGGRLAGLYIASRLRALGLEPASADGGYLQPVPLLRARVSDATTRAVVAHDAGRDSFPHGAEIALDIGGRSAYRDFRGEAVFAGTAALAADALADAGPLDGRIVVILGALGRAAPDLLPDWIARGAEGVIQLVPDPVRFERYARSREDFRLVVDADVESAMWQPRIPVLIGGPAITRALLADADLAPDAFSGERPFEALPLERTVETSVEVRFDPLDAANIAAVVPGTDPERRDEFVAYTAHYDHLGVGEPDADGDSIYNGFSDNAAGVAMLLAIAEAMRDDPPARSTLFLFFTAEERGLLGSIFYTAEPLVPLERTVAVINLDAGAPPAPPAEWSIAGGRASTLGALAAEVAEASGFSAEPSGASPNSDHWPFLRAGVPAAFLIPGAEWEGVDEDRQRELSSRWNHYHRPADEWAAEFPFTGLRRYAGFALALGRAVADATDRPRMLPADPR
ncbi:MAG: M28 family peptidase [Gemmatimonadota bacterium]